VTLYYLLTGKTPFQAANLVQMLAIVLEKRPDSPVKWRPEIPTELCRVILRCLEKDAGERFANYAELLSRPVYRQTLLRSAWIAARVTVFSLLLGYPLAYLLSFYAARKKNVLYQLVIIPLWVSYLVRAYAWKTILGTDGVLNTVLQFAHVTSHPLGFLLYSPFAVVLTLTHIYTPFAFLPIYASLEHIPRNLVEASDDLGASRIQTFRRVILPLSLPGVLAGATFAFVLSFGDFLAPLLLGGPSGIMISNIVVNLFGASYQWPLGAAISFCMLSLVLLLLWISGRLEKRWAYS
jgi:spermidine/putrescine transport system permease protein